MLLTKLILLMCIAFAMAQEEEEVDVIEVSKQSKDEIPAEEHRLNGDPLKSAERLLVNSLSKFAAGFGPFYKISEIYNVTSQPTTGILYKYNTDLIDNNSSLKKCMVSIWTRPKGENGVEVTFHCDGLTIAHA